MNNNLTKLFFCIGLMSVIISTSNSFQKQDELITYPIDLIQKRAARQSNAFEQDQAKILSLAEDVNSPYNPLRQIIIGQIKSVAPEAAPPTILRKVAIDINGDNIEEVLLFEFDEDNDPGQINLKMLNDTELQCRGVALLTQSYGEMYCVIYHRTDGKFFPQIERDDHNRLKFNFFFHTQRGDSVKVKIRTIKFGGALQWCAFISESEEDVRLDECLPRIMPEGTYQAIPQP